MENKKKEDQQYSLIPAYNFKVGFDGASKDEELSFSEASGIRSEIQYEEIWEGGVNNTSYKLPKAVKFPHLVLKKGSVPQTDSFVQWCEKAIYSLVFEPHTVQVVLNDGDKLP